ncbi:MAG: ROK family protein, partial [Bdellovibrionales bacterium]|nr:ROK family protein [Bdellovibrionales bacterium]
MSFLWGIDLGGTKVEGVVLDLSKRDANELPHVVTRQRIPSHAEQGYEAVLESIRTLIDLLSEDSGLQPKQIGVGTPGIEDPKTATMKNCNSTALNGRNLRKDLSGALEIGIRLANDANCFALAEHLFGAARGASTSFGV